MAVAAYAAAVSLMRVLDQIQQYPAGHRLRLDRDRIGTLHEKVCFLQDFLEVHSQRFHKGLEALARQIAAVAFEAEDIIDSHVVDQLIEESEIDLSFFWKLVADEGAYIIDSHVVGQLHKGSVDTSDADLSLSWEGIDNVIKKFDSIKKELMMIKEGMTIQDVWPRVSDPTRSSAPHLSGNNTMVGFDERLDQIIEELAEDKHDLQVLSIVGMAGIGKTTLARNAFDNSYIMRHFDKRTWVTVSQEYSTHGILLGLLRELDDEKSEVSDAGLVELGERLYKILYERRYLVVMDDVWSSEVWDDLRSFFPDNSNGSRIMVTTRESHVAISLGSQKPYLMDFLDEAKTWDLFCMKAFAKDGCCPPELEEVGKSIAKSCKGLPLAIVVIGGLLSKSNMTREDWERVAKDVNSFANSGDNEHCLKILSLSYNYLPIHLKLCFLYMRVFPEDDEIQVMELIILWVAEGILKPIKDKTLEEVAQEYLEDLIDRNLILRGRLGINVKIKTCRMHDLLRDLCIRESHKEYFYCVPKVQKIVDSKDRETICFLCSGRKACARTNLPQAVVSSQQTSLASCLVCDDCRIMYPQLNKLRLINVPYIAQDILHPTKLRYIYIDGDFKFVGHLIHILWNLQTLIIKLLDSDIHLPSEIWELPQLRHLVASESVLLDPPLITEVDKKDSTIILKNLQTLSCIRNFRWSDDAIERVPNLETLKIKYFSNSDAEWSCFSLQNLGRLHKLKSLLLATQAPLSLKKNIAFPHSLEKLTLWSCDIPWEEMTIIGSLPNLEVLKLQGSAFQGPDWNPIEGEFLRLKKLSIWGNDLVHWGAEKVHFPNLERLELEFMEYLEEIPSGIGEIETLRSIWLLNCRDSVVNSAKGILEEQHSFGNEDLQLFVDCKLVLPDGG